jgi:serine/threonine-protein kinase
VEDPSQPFIDPLVGKVLGGYAIHRRIGEGGMCIVYEALRQADGRRVALKVFRSDWSQDERVAKRFVREAMVASSLTNPNTIEILDFGSHGGILFMAMELLEGETLAERLKRSSRLPPIEAAQLAVQICSSLCEAHAKGIVHRDLKPENVMLSMKDGTTRVTVLDYGLALVRETSELAGGHTALTQVGTIIGTPSYMSPEQARGERPDARCDLYSLGVILYEMLAGRAPFQGDIARLLDQQQNEAPPPLDMDVPLSLAMLVWQMLYKRPDKRPASADAVRACLLEWLELSGVPSSSVLPDAAFEPPTLPLRRAPAPDDGAEAPTLVAFSPVIETDPEARLVFQRQTDPDIEMPAPEGLDSQSADVSTDPGPPPLLGEPSHPVAFVIESVLDFDHEAPTVIDLALKDAIGPVLGEASPLATMGRSASPASGATPVGPSPARRPGRLLLLAAIALLAVAIAIAVTIVVR